MSATSVSIALTAANGLFSLTTTDQNSNIILAPASIIGSFPGNTFWWGYSGTWPWVADGDSVTVNNQDGTQDYAYATVDVNQSVATALTFRVTGFGTLTSGSFNVELQLQDASSNVIYDQTIDFPVGTFDPTQITFNTGTPTAPVAYAHLYIYAHGVGTLTITDTELYQAGATANTYGKWTSNPVDLWATANVAPMETGLTLAQVGFYYGDLSNVDGADSVTHSVNVLSQFPSLVCDEPGQNTTSRQQYVQQQLVAAGVKLYGYLNAGVAEASLNECIPSAASIEAGILRCSQNGYVGVFLDGAGQPGVPMDELNALTDYAHSLGLHVFANSHPQDCLSTTVNTATLTAPTTAPTVAAVTSAGSTLPAGNYDVAYTLTSYLGETTASPVSTVTITSGQGIDLSTITGFDTNTQGVNVYLSIAAGSSTLGLVDQGVGAATTLNGLPTGGAAQPPSSNTAYVANPSGIACHMTRGDTCLWESFYSTSGNAYDTSGGTFAGAFALYAAGAALAAEQGVGLCGLAYALTGTSLTNYADWINAYVLAAGLGFTSLAYGSNSANNNVQWLQPPTFPALGNRITGAMAQTGSETYDAMTDQGVIRFTAVDSPVSRSYAAFQSAIAYAVTVTSAPTTTGAGRVTTTYEQSADQTTWTSATLANVTARYLREVIELQN